MASALAGCSLIDAAADDSVRADGSPDTDAAAADGDGAQAGCTLTDDFEDGVAAAMWNPFDDADAHVREANGVLEISFTGDVLDEWAGYELAQPIDLAEGEVRIEVRSAGGSFTGLEVWFDDMVLGLYTEDVETLIGEVSGTDSNDGSDGVPFDPLVHRVWRIRTLDGAVYWEVSQDGDQWDLVHTQAIPFPLDAVTIVVEAGGTLGEPTAGIESFAATPTGCAE
jgi:hypothetical protein